MNPVKYENQGRLIKRRVFYNGDGALKKGQPVCYQRGFADSSHPATDAVSYRDTYVQLAGAGNADQFAGVVSQDYKAKTGGQWILIYEPGSVCLILSDTNTVAGTTYLVGSYGGADGELFTSRTASERGPGVALALQTVDVDGGTGLVLAVLDRAAPASMKDAS